MRSRRTLAREKMTISIYSETYGLDGTLLGPYVFIANVQVRAETR